MYPSTISVNSGGVEKELSYTCFPVKLFRIVSSEKYCSLWWVECGSHFIVDVPRFEQEILRNEAIPEEDGFKTYTFTSFIRQLNLYGFRKVSVNSDTHVDPRDWQRYAHPYFIRSRVDYLDRIKRQPGSCRNRTHGRRNAPCVAETLKGHDLAMTQHFLCKGIRPSRKGPKPRYTFIAQGILAPLRRQVSRRRKQYHRPLVDCGGPCQALPLMIGSQSSNSFMAPSPLNQGVQLSPILPDGAVWSPTQMDVLGESHVMQQPGNSGQTCINGVAIVNNGSGQLGSSGWQNIGESVATNYINEQNFASLQVRQYGVPQEVVPQHSLAIPMMEESNQSNPVQITGEITPATSDQNLGQAQNESACSNKYDTTLNAAVLDDVGSMRSSTSQYCIMDDAGNIKLWPEDPCFQNEALLSDHVIFECGASNE